MGEARGERGQDSHIDGFWFSIFGVVDACSRARQQFHDGNVGRVISFGHEGGGREEADGSVEVPGRGVEGAGDDDGEAEGVGGEEVFWEVGAEDVEGVLREWRAEDGVFDLTPGRLRGGGGVWGYEEFALDCYGLVEGVVVPCESCGGRVGDARGRVVDFLLAPEIVHVQIVEVWHVHVRGEPVLSAELGVVQGLGLFGAERWRQGVYRRPR